MAKAMQQYFRENFDGAETSNIQPSESFPIYGIIQYTYLSVLDNKQHDDSDKCL